MERKRPPVRYGPVKRVKNHQQLHERVLASFSAFTLFTLYAFFAAEVDQREIPSNYYVRDAVDLLLVWTLDYPDTRDIYTSYGVPMSVFQDIWQLLSARSHELTLNWIDGGGVCKYLFYFSFYHFNLVEDERQLLAQQYFPRAFRHCTWVINGTHTPVVLFPS